MFAQSLEEKINPVFTVAEFNAVVNQHLNLLGDVEISGEITQMTLTRNKGVYMTLKDPDANAIISLSGYAPSISGINLINEGMKVVVSGKAEIYSPMGKFSVKIFKIVPAGKGALKEAYENLKTKLEGEGLFSPERKRELPDFVSRIALLTGKDSAAESDFLKILQEHNANFFIDFYPVHVQGKYAEREIIQTLKTADTNNYDCIVLTRGGGSLEDLIAFNDELLARTIFSLNTPVIVAVGHERDESIADFVADIRASTPSQAAYYLVVHNQNFLQTQRMLVKSIEEGILTKVNTLTYKTNSKFHILEREMQSLKNNILHKISKLENLIESLPQKITTLINELSSKRKLLASYNPLNIMERGFSLLLDNNNNVLNSVKHVKNGDKLNIRLLDGKIISEVQKITKI